MDKRIWILGSVGLAALAGCNTPADADLAANPLDEISPLGDTGAYDEVEFELAWDDPTYKPEVDRWAPNGQPISIPLGTSNAQDIDFLMWRGQSNGDKLGLSAAAIGDVDGDGYTDILAGSTYKSGSGGGNGGVYAMQGEFSSGTENVKTDSFARFYGESTSLSGEALGAGGDTNGDNVNDYIIGGRTYDDADEPWKINSGVAHVISGDTADRKSLPGGTLAEIRGAKAYDFVGASVDIIGDLNLDGYDDIIIGATGADENGATSGAAYVFYGPVTADTTTASADLTIGGENAGDGMGARIRDIGDWDGDGSADLVFGVRNEDTNGENAGAVYIVTSSTMPTTLADADYILRGKSAGAALGNAIAGPGDMDGDGLSDLLVGALGHGGKGAAYLVDGNSIQGDEAHIGEAASQSFTAQLSGDQFGSSVAGGDVNVDGTKDILIGANRQGTADRGAVYGYYGPFTGGSAIPATSADFKISGGADGDYFGSALEYAEHVDYAGAGTPSYGDAAGVVVGASARGSGDYGAVYLFRLD